MICHTTAQSEKRMCWYDFNWIYINLEFFFTAVLPINYTRGFVLLCIALVLWWVCVIFLPISIRCAWLTLGLVCYSEAPVMWCWRNDVCPIECDKNTHQLFFNSSPPGQTDIWRTIFSDAFFVNEKLYILIKISLKFVSKGPVDNDIALV